MQISTLVSTINCHSLGVHKAVLKIYSLLNTYHYEKFKHYAHSGKNSFQ